MQRFAAKRGMTENFFWAGEVEPRAFEILNFEGATFKRRYRE